jgi:hypothetical protein
MYLVLKIWHDVSSFDEILDDFKIVVLAGFKALAIVKNKLFVVARYDLLIDVRNACVQVWHVLHDIIRQRFRIAEVKISELTACAIPKAALITDDFPTPVYEWTWHQKLHHWG